MSATPVAREGAREVAHEFMQRLGLPGVAPGECSFAKGLHSNRCDELTAAFEARDASAVEVERVYREALEGLVVLSRAYVDAVAEQANGESDDPAAADAKVTDAHNALYDAVYPECRALDRVASLKGGTGG